MRHNDNWLSNLEYMELVEFLVEKTKDVNKVMNVKRLIREFKMKNESLEKDGCLKSRIRRFRSVIHKFPYMDTETKVKLMFGLSAPVDQKFLEKLRKEAEVKVDDFNRIIHYKKNGGGLELIGKHNPRKAEVSHNQILEFLAKKVEKTSGIIELTRLAKQLKVEIGSSQYLFSLRTRILQTTKQIYESELFDEDMKVRMMFATSTVVENYALEELRKNATVVVDDNNRIIEYQKNDGSLNLKTEAIRRVPFNQKQKKKSEIKSDEKGESEEEENVEGDDKSSDDSEHEGEDMEVKTRSGRISKKRFSDASLFNSQNDIGFSSPRNEKLKSSSSPTTSNKKRKILDHIAGAVEKKKKPVLETPPEDRYDDDYSFDDSYQYTDNTEVKSEPFKGLLNDNTTLKNIINNEYDFVEKIPAPTEHFVAPKHEELLMETNSKVDEENLDVSEKSAEDAEGINKPIQQDSTAPTENWVVPKYEKLLMDVREEEPEVIIFNDPIDKEVGEKPAEDIMEDLDDSMEMNSSNSQVKKGPIQQDSTSSEDVEKDHTPLNLIIESFHDFINILDLPILYDSQKKIESKLEECKKNSKMIFNQLIYFSLELCLLKVNENCAMEESLESFRLETFIRHLRHAVVHLKCPSLMEFQEKLKGIIGELRIQNKFVPVTAIRNALQGVIDNIINS